MRYRVQFDPRAARELSDLTPTVRERVAKRIDALTLDPRPRSAIRLAHELRGDYRLRIGHYRASYSIDDQTRGIRVWAIGHRSKFYDEAGRRRR
ncbi:MAG: type II toxin-antitoxin system RelE/ParE family toxin [Armatimonadetes bacterium]|nr:type II toxin-antitoxin system RelE/ParE family toxin [Armatimonadota bacterium]